MVGSGISDRGRSKEAVGMMARVLFPCLGLCFYCWRVRGGNGCKVGDDNGSLMLMWEYGFCRGRVAECLRRLMGEDPV